MIREVQRWNRSLEEYEVVEWLGASTEPRFARAVVPGDAAAGDQVFLELLEGPPTAEGRARLQQLWELSLSLAHCPGVLRPVASDIGGPRPALAFEAKPGKALEAALASPIERPRALHIALQLAQLVAGLHEARVIHRELSPQRLFLGAQDDLWFLGLGRAVRWGEADAGASSA